MNRSPRKKRAWGMPGAQCTRSLVREGSGLEVARVFTARSPESSGIPARNGFTAYFVISPAIGFLVTVALRKLAHPARLGVSPSARLDAGTEASGPHDFTVRISAVRLARLMIAHRQSPPCDL